MAKCLPQELWEKALDYYHNAYNHERITDPQRICEFIEKEQAPGSCEHVFHCKNGMQAPIAVVYFEPDSKYGERDVYGACEACDRELQEWSNRIVICDDCGRERPMSECMMMEFAFAEPLQEEDQVVLFCRDCFDGERHQSRMKREAWASDHYSPDPWANKAHNN